MADADGLSLTVVEALAVVAIPTFGLWVLFYNLNIEGLGHTVFVLGWFVLLPLIYFFGEDLPLINASERTDEKEPDLDPVTELQKRYEHGLINEQEFEQRLELLLETKQLEETYDRFGLVHERGDTKGHSSVSEKS